MRKTYREYPKDKFEYLVYFQQGLLPDKISVHFITLYT